MAHYALVVNMWSLPIVKYCPFLEKNVTDKGTARINGLGGGHGGDNQVL